MAASGLESSLEKELKAWRENRSRENMALAVERTRLAAPSAGPAGSSAADSRRVRVNGQEVLVVSRSRRSFS